ncbi:MAG: (2Fe-2S)-binding protein [Clostridiales bacterium]|nr:(2Fe-2S)-binding protein [Clostridiales bacterium]
MENYEICHCMGVTYGDIEAAMHETNQFGEVLDTFKHVQEATSCSTGCGGCYNDVLKVISDIMHGYGAQ